MTVELMNRLDEHYKRTRFYGTLWMTNVLREQGFDVNRKLVIRGIRMMGLEAKSSIEIR